MFSLDYQLDEILKETLKNRFKIHEDMAELVRNWAKKHFEIFTNKNYLSNTITVIENTKGISIADLNYKLQEIGYRIANGYGDLKEKTFRISHMDDYTLDDIKELLNNMDDILGFYKQNELLNKLRDFYAIVMHSVTEITNEKVYLKAK